MDEIFLKKNISYAQWICCLFCFLFLCKEKEVLYDEYKLYLTLDLVKRLAAKHMPEFLTSDVLAQLTEAGILSSSIVKTLTLSTGHPKNVRLRSINRSFVNGYGRRDITTIST